MLKNVSSSRLKELHEKAANKLVLTNVILASGHFRWFKVVTKIIYSHDLDLKW